MRHAYLIPGLIALPFMLGLAASGVAWAGDPIPDVDVTLNAAGDIETGDITNEMTTGDITTGDITSSDIVDWGDGSGTTKNYNSTRSNRSVAINADDGSGDVTTNESTNIAISEEGTRLISDELMTGDVTTFMNKGDLINKSVAGDDDSDSINFVMRRPPAEPPHGRVIEIGEGALGPINITELDASVTGNMVKGHWPTNMSGTWDLQTNRSIHDNPVSGNIGVTTTILSTGDNAAINNSTTIGTGSISP